MLTVIEKRARVMEWQVQKILTDCAQTGRDNGGK
jgi:hypothetical protein